MRGLAVLLLLLVAPAEALLLEDPTGDVTAKHCEDAETPVSGWDVMDLKALEITEEPQGFIFTVHSGLVTSEERRQDYGNYFIWFSHGDVTYMVRLLQANDNGAPFATMEMTGQTARPFGAFIDNIDTWLDTAANTQSGFVPRDLILNEDGRAPERGDNFTDVLVASSAHSTGVYACWLAGSSGGPALVGDQMSDDWTLGNGPSMEIQFGGGQVSGPLVLDVDRPFRASNGEATTFRFEVLLRNDGGEDRTFRLTNRSLPSNWDLDAGGELLKLNAGSGASFPVFLTVPFAHQHGVVTAFDLVFEDTNDSDVWASRQLGIHYHTIPQPAGHHDTLWFHSREWSDAAAIINPLAGSTNGVLSMSTLEHSEGDSKSPIRGDTNTNTESTFHRWEVCLEPELLMGLDFDLTRTGELILNLATTRPVNGQLTGDLIWIGPGEDPTWCSISGHRDREQMILGSLEPTPVTMSASSTLQVQATFVASQEADLVPPVEGADMMLALTLAAEPVPLGAGGIDLMPGGSLQLPLLEYHEATPEDVPTPERRVDEDPNDVFIDDEPVEESPAPLLLAVVGVLGALGIRRRFPPN